VPGGGSVQGEPGVLVGDLTSPGSFSGSIAATTFTSAGILLAANTTYWVVLKGLGTENMSWQWTNDNTGLGTGFQHTWGHSDNSGGTWLTFDTQPMQMQV